MNAPLHIVLSWADWADLFAHYLMLSLMSVGGAISTTAEMHRYLVEQHHWLTQAQFKESIALAQAAPGPNVLFVALMGWNVGLNAGSMGAAFLGVAVTMIGILIPSTVLTYVAAQWGHRNRELRAVRAFKQGMAPRAEILGDTGANHPDRWIGGLASPDLHAIAILFARDEQERQRVAREHAAYLARTPGVDVLSALDLDAIPPFNYARDHFGYRDRLTQPEIAERTGAPLGTVKSRVRLGLLALRRALSGEAGVTGEPLGDGPS